MRTWCGLAASRTGAQRGAGARAQSEARTGSHPEIEFTPCLETELELSLETESGLSL